MADLTASVQWLNSAGEDIGTGLVISIQRDTLINQDNYLTYLDITQPAPAAAVKARVIFVSSLVSNLAIDKVILARVTTPNLVLNPSFENGSKQR